MGEPVTVIGFTGTRQGMNELQLKRLKQFLQEGVGVDGYEAEDMLFVHGDCLGADAQAHEIAKGLGMQIHARPCDMPDARAYTDADVTHEPLTPLARNKAIAKVCTFLIAAPKENTEQLRSGTWATVRYAKKAGKKVVVIPRGKEK